MHKLMTSDVTDWAGSILFEYILVQQHDNWQGCENFISYTTK